MQPLKRIKPLGVCIKFIYSEEVLNGFEEIVPEGFTILDQQERLTLFQRAQIEVKNNPPERFRLDCHERAARMYEKVLMGDIEGYREIHRMMAYGIIPQCPRTEEELCCADLLQLSFTIATGHQWFKKGYMKISEPKI